MSRRCAVHVATRHYGQPGQCEKRKNIKPVKYQGEVIRACVVHAKMILKGRTFEAAR